MSLRQDFRIRQGETWAYTYVHKDADDSPVDLTGYSARMAIRDRVGGVLEAYLSSESSEQDGGSITLGGAAGTVALGMTAVQTKRMSDNLTSASVLIDPAYRYKPEVVMVYDLELVSGAGVVTRALAGRVTVSRGITQ